MESQQIRQILMRELPVIMQQDPEVRRFILELSRQYFADRVETENRFDRILEEMRKEREESSRRWEEQNRKWEEQNRKWEANQQELRAMREEQNRRWEEQNRKWEANQQELRAMREEQNRKWEANQQELRAMREEQNRKWEANQQELRAMREEQNLKWEANQQELRAMREEQDRRWEEQNRKWEEQNRRWEANQQELRAMREEHNRRWEENQKTIQRMLDEIHALNRKHDTTIGALGARWGLYTEQSFRSALRSILEESFGVRVVNVVEYDDAGEVFGRPDQIELDLVIKDSVFIICEISSSMSKADMYTFERKARFYEKRHERKADRLMVISPMVSPQAQVVAQKLGIEVYTHAEATAPVFGKG